MVIGGMKSSWRLLIVYPRGLILFNIFINDLDGGQTVPSASLQEWLMHQATMPTFRGALTGWRDGFAGTS